MSRDLFLPPLPPGFEYRPDFITADEEETFVREIERIEFALFEMRGVVAKRRVAFYGQSYDEGPARPIPEFHYGGSAERLRAQHPAGGKSALLDYVQDVAEGNASRALAISCDGRSRA